MHLVCRARCLSSRPSAGRHDFGRVLRVISTDPGSVCDMAAFAEQTGNPLLEQGTEGGKYVFFIKKA